MTPSDPVVTRFKERFGNEILSVEEFRGQVTLCVKSARALEMLKSLRDDAECPFDMLTDLTGVDYLRLDHVERFAVVYQLTSLLRNERLRVKAYVGEARCEIESVHTLWGDANWLEREVWDMYGIRFLNHPDLRRILTPDDYTGHPLRKDYPLKGRGERSNFPKYIVEEAP
ncbi:MAG: NADH-quinone oxidoreductase subunit C [Planctomycetes bacterium]|nr:NADH-quinone oxidoreductase subunit C [Planctomycetota bacterium]